MSDLKRWTFVGIDGMSAPEATEHWRETPDGKWVDYEDVAALKEENERLKAQIARLSGPVSQREVIQRSGNQQPQSPSAITMLFNAILRARKESLHEPADS